MDETRTTIAPKSKFAFKSTIKKNDSAISLSDAAELAMQQRAKLSGHQQSLASSGDSSTAPTPADLAPPPNEATGRPQETLRRGSLGSFLKAAGVRSTEPQTSGHHGTNVRKMSFATSNSVEISSFSDMHIILPSTAAHATSSGSLTNLRHCIVDMSVPTSTGQPFAGLTIKDVKQSLLLCGNVSGAAHITDVKDSVILVTTRQFRMHQCSNCIIYLHVSSRPIIEDCTRVRFAPLPKDYVSPLLYIYMTMRVRRVFNNIPKLHFTNNMSTNNMSATNQWNQVQDFKWHKAERNPNWSELSPEETVPEETWAEIVPGGPGRSMDDILKAVGVLELSEQSTEKYHAPSIII